MGNGDLREKIGLAGVAQHARQDSDGKPGREVSAGTDRGAGAGQAVESTGDP